MRMSVNELMSSKVRNWQDLILEAKNKFQVNLWLDPKRVIIEKALTCKCFLKFECSLNLRLRFKIVYSCKINSTLGNILKVKA